MDKPIGTVFVIDDEPRVLKAITRLLSSEGWRTCSYQSAREFLAAHDDTVPGCIVLDLLMPDLTGLDVQRELVRRGQYRPIIFLSGRSDVPSSVSAMKSGAIDFLTKPVDGPALLSAVRGAVESDIRRRAAVDQISSLKQRLSMLTAREREVLDGVVAGLLNKQIAGRLGIVEKTVKVHRARAITKLGAHSTADLVRIMHVATSDAVQRQAPFLFGQASKF